MYQSGAKLDLSYPGPVLYLVETGMLTVELDGKAPTIIYSGQDASSTTPIVTDQTAILPAAYAIFDEDGDLGTTRNDQAGPTVILALLVVAQPLGVSETGEETAVPAVSSTVTPENRKSE